MVLDNEKMSNFALVEVRIIKKKGREKKLWYAIRVTYNRELKVKEELDARGIKSFVPMQYRREERNGVMVKRLVPSIMDRETSKPITVPDHQMENFIKVAGTYEEKLIYLNPEPGDFSQGERVRIIGGPFEGAEGVFVRIKRDRRVLINIPGVVAVATTHVHLSMLEKITDPDPNQLDNAL